ncbi:MAG TPA: ammonium transporter [Gemmatimonadaceae bacterium]|nr:ammonium transporter [Gemmatimonadaceae bacterium]
MMTTDAPAAATAISAGDTAWLMVSTAFVLLMIPGLALFYSGLVRVRAALNTVMMSFAALALVGVQWVLFGYSLAFAPGRAVGGLAWAGLHGVSVLPGPYSATVPHIAFAAFQAMFAGITVALISGAMVERIRFSIYLAFALLWTTLVYDPLAHWVWASDGWLHTLGALDFAGGTVVHISAGTAALVAAVMLGRRGDLGRTPLLPHNVPFTLLGAGLLWVGWIGFNAGSSLAADGVAANALVTTHAAAAAALLTWLALDIRVTGQATAVGGATGAVVGLVAITPAAGYVTPLAALAIGALGACASFAAIRFRSRTRIDDALDVFACHGVAGIVGALLTGVFATKAVNAAGADGLFAGNPRQLLTQAIAVVATIAFTAPVTALVLAALRTVGSLRVPLPGELTGVDLAEHGEHAYHDGDTADIPGGRTRLSEGVILASTTVPPEWEVKKDAA